MFSGTACTSIAGPAYFSGCAAEKVLPPPDEGSYGQATANALTYVKRYQHKAWVGARHSHF